MSLKKLLMIVAASCMSLPAVAATVALDPSTLTVDPDGSFTIDVVIDATDAPGDHPGAIQGNLAITWDSSLAQYDDFVYANSEALSGPTLTDGKLEFGFTNGDEVGTIGTLSFTATGAEGEIIDFGLAHQFGFSTFVNLLPANVSFDPDLTGTAVSVVPIPAAAWMMFSALGVLGGIARRRKTA